MRQRILAALVERHQAGLPEASLDDLASLLSMPKSTLRHHVAWLEQHHVIETVDVPSTITRLALRLIDPRTHLAGGQ